MSKNKIADSLYLANESPKGTIQIHKAFDDFKKEYPELDYFDDDVIFFNLLDKPVTIWLSSDIYEVDYFDENGEPTVIKEPDEEFKWVVFKGKAIASFIYEGSQDIGHLLVDIDEEYNEDHKDILLVDYLVKDPEGEDVSTVKIAQEEGIGLVYLSDNTRLSYKARFKPRKKRRGRSLIMGRNYYRKNRHKIQRSHRMYRRKHAPQLKRRSKMPHRKTFASKEWLSPEEAGDISWNFQTNKKINS